MWNFSWNCLQPVLFALALYPVQRQLRQTNFLTRSERRIIRRLHVRTRECMILKNITQSKTVKKNYSRLKLFKVYLQRDVPAFKSIQWDFEKNWSIFCFSNYNGFLFSLRLVILNKNGIKRVNQLENNDQKWILSIVLKFVKTRYLIFAIVFSGD